MGVSENTEDEQKREIDRHGEGSSGFSFDKEGFLPPMPTENEKEHRMARPGVCTYEVGRGVWKSATGNTNSHLCARVGVDILERRAQMPIAVQKVRLFIYFLYIVLHVQDALLFFFFPPSFSP